MTLLPSSLPPSPSSHSSLLFSLPPHSPPSPAIHLPPHPHLSYVSCLLPLFPQSQPLQPHLLTPYPPHLPLTLAHHHAFRYPARFSFLFLCVFLSSLSSSLISPSPSHSPSAPPLSLTPPPPHPSPHLSPQVLSLSPPRSSILLLSLLTLSPTSLPSLALSPFSSPVGLSLFQCLSSPHTLSS